MISAMRVGRVEMLLCIHRKSSRALCTSFLRAILPFVFVCKGMLHCAEDVVRPWEC